MSEENDNKERRDRRSAERFQVRSPLGGRIPLVALMQALAVADHLNFRRAADALGISQSAVSLRIKTLEETLGILLFERRHRGVRLTQAGRSFLEEVSQGVEHLDYAVKCAGMIARGELGSLGIGLHSSIASGFLADLLQRYRDGHPGVDIEIAEGQAHDIIRSVREERLDVAFVLGAPTIVDCHTKPLWREALVIALPDEHPLAKADFIRWSDLASETFIVRHGGAGSQLHDHVALRLAENWHHPSVQRFDVGRDTLMSMVAQGYGLTLTTEATTKVSFPGVIFRSIADEPGPVVFSAVWSPFNRSPALRELLDAAQRLSKHFGKAGPSSANSQ